MNHPVHDTHLFGTRVRLTAYPAVDQASCFACPEAAIYYACDEEATSGSGGHRHLPICGSCVADDARLRQFVALVVITR